MPEKSRRRRRRRKRSPSQGVSRRRLGEDVGSSSGSRVESDSSSKNFDAQGAPRPRYLLLLDSRLARLQLPPSADGGKDDPCSVDRPDLHLPSAEIVEALTSRNFLNHEMRDALVEFHVQKCLSGETHGRGRDSREFHPADVPMDSVDSGDDSHEQFVEDYRKLLSRNTPVDQYTKLDEQQLKELDLKHARFRIKALLLLKGKAIDKLDDATFDRKYPPELIVENSYFLNYHDHDAFGWFFDFDLCQLDPLTDYQRLVLTNYGGIEYQDRNLYRSYYNNPETDREYLLYWETITEKLKWIEGYIHRGRTSDDWEKMKMKARRQAIRAATDFDHIHWDLANNGFEEFIWSTYYNVLELKDLDGVFLEIWKLVIRDQACFGDAVKKVYDMGKFPSWEQCIKDNLKGMSRMEEQFRMCTAGITAKVPDYRARELIAEQIKNKLSRMRSYEQYAQKKLKIAEYLGLIRKTST